jgi:hypothetical protein
MRSMFVFALVAAIVVMSPPATPGAAGAGPPAQCAGHTLRVVEGNQAAGREARLEIRRGQTVVQSIAGWTFEDVQCVDATGDRTPELIVTLYSGGAHCCTTIHVFQFQPSPRWILNYAAGNAGGFSIERGPGGRPALVLGDDGLAYYGDLCFACSPSSLPLVACYEGTRFVDCTRRFPALIQQAIETYTEQLKEAVRSTHGSRIEYMRGAALGVYAAYALLGKESDGLTAVRRLGATPDVLAWLGRQREGVKKWLGGRPGRLRP